MTLTVQQVVEAQAHLGSLKNESHPKTSQYWETVQNGLVVINPEKIISQLESAKQKIQQARSEGKEILVVCEKKMYAEDLEMLAKKGGFSFLNYKIPGGFLTNFDTFKKRIDNINEMMTFLDSEEYTSLTKKEQLIYKRKFARVNKIYKGVTKLSKKPDLVIVIDGTMLATFLDEVQHTKSDTIVIASTNFPRYWPEANILMSNISSYKSLDFVMKYILS